MTCGRCGNEWTPKCIDGSCLPVESDDDIDDVAVLDPLAVSLALRDVTVRELRAAAAQLEAIATQLIATDRWRPIWLGSAAHAQGLVSNAVLSLGEYGATAHRRPR